MLWSGLVKFAATGPTGLVLFKVNVDPCYGRLTRDASESTGFRILCLTTLNH
jgi:hypothetical protein